MKISDIFVVKTGQRIIQEEVYVNKGDFPCVTAQTANDGITWYASKEWLLREHKSAIIDAEECITWTKDGAKCGTLFYRNYSFYPNDHCGVLIPKGEYKNDINLKWFLYTKQEYIKGFVSQQGSQGMLYNTEMGEIEIEYPFPDKDTVQDKIVEQYEKLIEIRTKIQNELDKLNELFEYEFQNTNYMEYKVEQVALLNKGSNKISEEMLYQNHDDNGFPVYSSATENKGLMGKVKETCFNNFDKQGNATDLTWTTNGYAGVVFYRDLDYLYSEKCGRIVIRKEFQNLILPKYLMYLLNQITYKHTTSESNNGKLDIIHMSNIPIQIPVDEDGNIDINAQNDIVKQYERIEYFRKNLEGTLAKIDAVILG